MHIQHEAIVIIYDWGEQLLILCVISDVFSFFYYLNAQHVPRHIQFGDSADYVDLTAPIGS